MKCGFRGKRNQATRIWQTTGVLAMAAAVAFSCATINSQNAKRKRIPIQPRMTATGTTFMPVWSPSGDRIAFTYSKFDNLEVFTVKPDGTDPVNISKHPDVDYLPVWSPDGRTLAFLSRRNGAFDICLTDASGDNLKCPTKSLKEKTGRKWDDLYPAWSPDSKTIAYCSYQAGYSQIWFMDADGSNPRAFYKKESCYPNFSADGRKLAFGSEGDLIVYDLKKGTTKNITEGLINGNMVDDTIPAWAPKGDRLAFIGRFESDESEIYTISSSGKKVRRVTDNLFEDFIPRWQPDGKGIIYAAYVSARPPEIFISDPMSPEKKRITDNFIQDFSPAVSPNGKKVVFLRRVRGRDEIFLMDKDGKNVKPLFAKGFNPQVTRAKKKTKMNKPRRKAPGLKNIQSNG